VATVDRLARWMRERLHAAGARGFVVGLSGGVDSAVVARLAQLAAPGDALGVLLPCHSDPQDERDAMLVARHFSLPIERIELSTAYDTLVAAMQPALASIIGAERHGKASKGAPESAESDDEYRGRVPLANIKPRLRMTTLYFVANSLNYLVAGTGNGSEMAVGYFTKWGDGGVDLLPLGRLPKSQVRALAQELRVPADIVERPPSAGLWIGQNDEEDMGFTYADLERYLEGGPQAVTPALAMKIERLVRASDHKRELPAVPDF
jgi:NAD+ synthase